MHLVRPWQQYPGRTPHGWLEHRRQSAGGLGGGGGLQRQRVWKVAYLPMCVQHVATTQSAPGCVIAESNVTAVTMDKMTAAEHTHTLSASHARTCLSEPGQASQGVELMQHAAHTPSHTERCGRHGRGASVIQFHSLQADAQAVAYHRGVHVCVCAWGGKRGAGMLSMNPGEEEQQPYQAASAASKRWRRQTGVSGQLGTAKSPKSLCRHRAPDGLPQAGSLLAQSPLSISRDGMQEDSARTHHMLGATRWRARMHAPVHVITVHPLHAAGQPGHAAQSPAAWPLGGSKASKVFHLSKLINTTEKPAESSPRRTTPHHTTGKYSVGAWLGPKTT